MAPAREIIPSFESSDFEQYWESFEDGDTREAEATHSYNGHEIPVATVTAQRPISWTPYHFGMIEDISARKAREEEMKRQNEQFENFADIVSHDLQNPLNDAQGYIDMLQADITRYELYLVDNALDRMGVLITELLELAQSEFQRPDALLTIYSRLFKSAPRYMRVQREHHLNRY